MALTSTCRVASDLKDKLPLLYCKRQEKYTHLIKLRHRLQTAVPVPYHTSEPQEGCPHTKNGREKLKSKSLNFPHAYE